MKKYFILILVLLCSSLFAQAGYKTEYKLSIISTDNLWKNTLTKSCGSEEKFEGSFSDNQMFDFIPQGKIQKGGFSFVDSDVYGGMADAMKEKWLKNNFTEIGFSSLNQPPVFSKALSFCISVLPDEKKSDSLHLYFKYAIYSLKDSTQIHTTDFDLRVKVDYKYLVIPDNKEISVDFLDPVFKGYKFRLNVDYLKEDERILNAGFEDLAVMKIKQSSGESAVTDNDLNISVTFLRKSLFVMKDKAGGDIIGFQEFSSLSKYNCIEQAGGNSQTISDKRLKTPVYYCKINIPFILYNKDKTEKYNTYKNSTKYLQSEYNLTVVPVSFSKEGLTADVFIDYSKLKLGDNIKRWTPIYKRIVIPYKNGIKILIPKENWTANFIRDGNQYDIFGYNDYEKFIDEAIIIYIK